MNAQDKAKELIEKCEKLLGYDLPASNQYELIKKCAIISVDEILNELECAYNGEPITTNEHKNYWKEVKKEIENL